MTFTLKATESQNNDNDRKDAEFSSAVGADYFLAHLMLSCRPNI
jgi:hypothetical protein